MTAGQRSCVRSSYEPTTSSWYLPPSLPRALSPSRALSLCTMRVLFHLLLFLLLLLCSVYSALVHCPCDEKAWCNSLDPKKIKSNQRTGNHTQEWELFAFTRVATGEISCGTTSQQSQWPKECPVCQPAKEERRALKRAYFDSVVASAK